MNLVTDGFPALALAMEPPEPGLMSRPPRSPRASILSWQLGSAILLRGLLLAAVTFGAFALLLGPEGEDVATARTMAFCIMVYGQLFLALAARSRVWTFWQLGPTTNLYVFAAVALSGLLQFGIIALLSTRTIFQATTLSPMEWVVLLALALAPVTAIELVKLGYQLFGRSPSTLPSNSRN
jgi:Ca2+-transporting ATPase